MFFFVNSLSGNIDFALFESLLCRLFGERFYARFYKLPKALYDKIPAPLILLFTLVEVFFSVFESLLSEETLEILATKAAASDT